MSAQADRTIRTDPPVIELRPHVRRSTHTRVLVAHDNRLVAEALMFALDTDSALEPIGYALDGWEAYELVAALQPDAIVVGTGLGGVDSLSLTRIVSSAWPDVRIVLLAEAHAPRTVEEAYAAGAVGYLPSDRSANDLLNALEAACASDTAESRGRPATLGWSA